MSDPAVNQSAARNELPLWELDLPVLADADPRDAAAPGRDPQAFPILVPEGPASNAHGREAQTHAQRLLGAEDEATRIIARAHHEAQRLREAAHQEGIEDLVGLQATAFQQIVELIRADLASQFQARWEQLELEAARLCVELAEGVIHRAIAEDDSIVVETVRKGLARMTGARSVTVRVSPACEAAIAAAQPELAQELSFGVALEIVPDETVSPGGVVLQGPNGEVDLQIEAQIARLREAAEEALQ